MIINPTCPIHGHPAKADGQTCTCWKITVTFTTSDSTNIPTLTGWSKHLQAMRDWSATLYGRIDGEQKQPVPDAFQREFKDGELEP